MVDQAAKGTGARDRLEVLEAELQRFVEVASGEFGAKRVIVFGSLARAMDEGAQAINEWSDLDVVVVAETDQPFYERIKQLRKLVRPKVGSDVLVYTPSEWEWMKSERSFVKNEVLEKGKVVYEEAG